jgi:hypothetical protein
MIKVMTIQEQFLDVKQILCIIRVQQTFSNQWTGMTVYMKLIMTTGTGEETAIQKTCNCRA